MICFQDVVLEFPVGKMFRAFTALCTRLGLCIQQLRPALRRVFGRMRARSTSLRVLDFFVRPQVIADMRLIAPLRARTGRWALLSGLGGFDR